MKNLANYLIPVFSFCRRRLPVVMVRSKMAENIKTATQLIEQVIKITFYLVLRIDSINIKRKANVGLLPASIYIPGTCSCRLRCC